MVAWSSTGLKNIAKVCSLRSLFTNSKNGLKVFNNVPIRMSSHETIMVKPSRYQYIKFKDFLHFYIALGAIPLGLLIIYVNLFIGPAELVLTPEDYNPKPWEYSRHPITRFFVKYIVCSPQEAHERTLHYIYQLNDRKEIRFLENKIHDLMKERQDYQAWYLRKPILKYEKYSKEYGRLSLEENEGSGPFYVR